MKILLAVDDSKFSAAAARMVRSQSRAQLDEVQVVHVVDIFSPLVPDMVAHYPGVEHERDAQRKPAEELVARIGEQLRSAGLHVTTRVGWGDPKSTIMDIAEEWKPDLIAMGSHGRAGLERFLLGSVSETVLQHAKCSVEIAKIPHVKKGVATSHSEINKVLLAIEDSRFSEAATSMVIQQVRPSGAEVRVLHVVEPFPLMMRKERSAQESSLERVSREEATKAEALVAATGEKLRAANLKVSTTIEVGNARAKILHVAQTWRANLIVMGSHGRKGLERFLLGEVAGVVARHARCSVEIVRTFQAS